VRCSMVDRIPRIFRAAMIRSQALILMGLLGATSGCAVLGPIEDPCGLANRDAEFGILMQNSLQNVYNLCLYEMRQDIADQWGEP
jgi:hypothetical protein